MNFARSRYFAALVALFSTLLVTGAHARPILETIDVEVMAAGPGGGESGVIDVEYDSDLLFFGDEILFGDEFALTLNLFGQTFDNTNDIGFDFGFPVLEFFDFSIVFIDFVINEFDFFNPTDITDPRIEEIGGGDVIDGRLLVRTFGPAKVPAPATLGLLMLGLAGAGLFRRARA